MHEIDQRDRELLNALQGEVPLASTPFALIGQSVDMSEKEVIKRVEKLKRDGVLKQISGHFEPRALGYRSCLVAAHVHPDRIDEAAAVISAHPGVTRNYRRNHKDLNLWFTLYVAPQSQIGLERTIDLLAREAECSTVRPLPTLRLFKGTESDGQVEDAVQGDVAPLTPAELECVRLLQNDLPAQPRPFDALARTASLGSDEILSAARSLHRRGQMRRFGAVIVQKKPGFVASAMGLWHVPEAEIEEASSAISKHKSVSHCYLRPVFEDWPYNLYATVHARSVDECESIINDLASDTGLRQKQTLFPTKEYKRVRLNFFSREAEEWESHRSDQRAAAV